MMNDNATVTPVPVVIGNLSQLGQEIRNTASVWATPRIKNTSIKTYILDPAAVNPGVTDIQIATYEVNRKRVAIAVTGGDVLVTTDIPVSAPDVAPPVGIPAGGVLTAQAVVYEFFGPDALWLNTITGEAAATVTVVKEYC